MIKINPNLTLLILPDPLKCNTTNFKKWHIAMMMSENPIIRSILFNEVEKFGSNIRISHRCSKKDLEITIAEILAIYKEKGRIPDPALNDGNLKFVFK